MIEFYQLEQLVMIEKKGTISKAAEELMISQPALTRSIQRLEEELGMSLFDRKKNKIEINENGRLAVSYAQKLLDEKDLMITHLQQFDRSHRSIQIGSIAPAPLWGIKAMIQQKEPEIIISEDLKNDEKELLQGLYHDEYTIIALTHPISDPHYICDEIFDEQLYLSVPPAHPLAMYDEISFQDIDGQSVLLLSHIGFWNELTQKMIPKSHLLFQEDINTFNELTKMSALPNFRSNVTILREDDENNRVYIPINDECAHVHYYAIYHKNKKKQFQSLKKDIQDIDWSQTK